MIFIKSARESHTLPIAKLLRQNSTGLASDFRLHSAFDVISSDPLSSHVSLPLSAWNFARVSFSSIHSANTVGERSNFLTLASHLFSVDGSSRPFQSTRFRYSCIRNWVMRWSPCALGTRTRTLCSPFDVADNLSRGGRSWYAFELKPTAVLGRSSTLSDPALFKIGMPFFIASSPVHNRFQTCTSRPYSVGSLSTRDPPIFSIRAWHFLMDRVAVAQLIFSKTSTEASFWFIFLPMLLTLFDCATTLPIVTRSLSLCIPYF